MFSFSQFIHPFTALVAGPTGCGKTEFIVKLIKNKDIYIHPAPNKIFYCYSIWQNRFEELKKLNIDINFIHGLTDTKDIIAVNNNLIILDDLMKETAEDDEILNLFTKGSHHNSISVLLLTQNIFNKGKHSRTISLNAHYIILFKNPRDKTQISYLSRQMYPKQIKFLEDAYYDATEKPYGYLFIDLKQTTNDDLRIQSNIFLTKEHIIYLNKKK